MLVTLINSSSFSIIFFANIMYYRLLYKKELKLYHTSGTQADMSLSNII